MGNFWQLLNSFSPLFMQEETNSKPIPRRLWLGLGAMAAALGAGAALWRFSLAQPQDQALEQLWGFQGEQVQGGQFEMEKLKGKPILINFWATWCPPCVEELPLIEAFYQENRSKSWQVIGLAADNAKNVSGFLSKNRLSFPTPLAGVEGIELSRTLGNLSGALPFSVAINAQGSIALRHMGKLSAAQLREISKLA
jgi:thiol-disulfide isomerase/thioredoxin